MDQFLTIKQTCVLTGYGPSSIYRFMNQENFPKPIKFSACKNLWRESEVRAWFEARIAAALAKAA